MVEEQRIQDFLEALSSKAAVPGGGGTSALAGALGNALGQMVVNLTVGKKKYADVEVQMYELLDQLKRLQQEMVFLADEDERVFAPLAKAYSLPSTTAKEKEYKDQVMEENLLAASLIPINIMKKSIEILDILEILEDKGSRMVVSDVGVGVQLTKAALLGAVMNVFINTKSMKDRRQAEKINEQANQMIIMGSKQADDVYQRVINKIQS